LQGDRVFECCPGWRSYSGWCRGETLIEGVGAVVKLGFAARVLDGL
jgi:hypothetical protein